MAVTFFAGYSGSVQYRAAGGGGGFVTLRAKEWSLRLVSDEYDVTHAKDPGNENAGYVDTHSSLLGAEGSVKAVWNDEDNPFGVAPTLRPSGSITLVLFISRVDVVGFRMTAYVTTFDTSVSVRGLPEFSFTFKSSGRIVMPGE